MEALALTDDSQIGKRSEPRTRLAVMASMASPAGTGPVMICNLSSRGALIDGDRLPEVGEPVELRRGELRAVGRVRWKDASKAGVQFDIRIKVADWTPAANSGQQTVDNIFQQLKAGAGKPSLLAVKPPAGVPAIELEQTAEALEALADTLAEDGNVVARHSTDLVILDIAAQIMRRLAAAG